MSGKAGKVLYKPVSIASSIVGGLLAGALFTRIWQRATGEDAPPDPASLDRSTREVLLGAMLHGALFGLVQAIVDRASARGYHRMTGATPAARRATRS